MRRQRQANIDDNAYDAFLDIVANLVGILVILIMVIGVRARNAWQDQSLPEVPLAVVDVGEVPDVDEETSAVDQADHLSAVSKLSEEIAAAHNRAQHLEHDAHVLHSRAATIAEQIDVATARRNQLQLVISAVENEIRVQQAKLTENKQAALERVQRISAAERELESLKSKIHTVNLETLAPTELTHHGTPIAKTVFGSEEHFRLMSDRIVRVPLPELLDSLRRDAQTKLWKMKDSNEITESMSPLDGFRLKYTMKRVERLLDTPNGRVKQRSIELDRFTLYPTAEGLGEPVATAIGEASAFAQFVAKLNPDDTSITVWTYPDSFDSFRSLQDHLVTRGFQVAARPLPEGHPISGSPSGSRSARNRRE